MKKISIMIAAGVALALGYWLLSPLWRTEVVNEALPDNTLSSGISENATEGRPTSNATTEESSLTERKELHAGSFTGFDRLHQGSGTAKIVQVGDKTYLRFESDFTVTNGPDLFVGFGKNGQYSSGSEVGALKGNVGSQNYELPGGFKSEQFNEVYVWCRAFRVPFARANLIPVP